MSTAYELSGKIIVINDPQSFPSGFTKRQFVVETTEDKYPQQIPLEFVKDACVKLDSFNVGDQVKVAFNLRGNEYNGKYYTQLSAWKIERTDGQQQSAPHQGRSSEQNGAKPPASVPDYDDEDDIPF